jgi:indolepyruvate decarboxylase
VTVTAERATASSTRETMTMTVGDFLLRRIQEAGDVLVAEDGTSYDTMIFIESIMDPFDAPTAVMMSGNNGADIDCGPRGPQHRGNMLIRPAI